MEKVIVFTSKSQNFEYDSKTCEYFNVYANLLANQGKLDYAIYYLKGILFMPDHIIVRLSILHRFVS